MSTTLEDLEAAIDHFQPKFNDGTLVPSAVVVHMLREHYGDGPVTIDQLENIGKCYEGLFVKILACARASTQHDYDEAVAISRPKDSSRDANIPVAKTIAKSKSSASKDLPDFM